MLARTPVVLLKQYNTVASTSRQYCSLSFKKVRSVVNVVFTRSWQASTGKMAWNTAVVTFLDSSSEREALIVLYGCFVKLVWWHDSRSPVLACLSFERGVVGRLRMADLLLIHW